MEKELTKKKKKYCKPELRVEEFVPNEYIAACDTEPGKTTYYFECNAGAGVTHTTNSYWGKETTKYVWNVYTNAGEKKNNGLFGACGETHTVEVVDGEDIPFVEGYMDNYYTSETEHVKVWIWGRPYINNTHCMAQLGSQHTAPYKNNS